MAIHEMVEEYKPVLELIETAVWKHSIEKGDARPCELGLKTKGK